MFRSTRVALLLATAAMWVGVQAAAPTIDTATIESVTALKGSHNRAENGMQPALKAMREAGINIVAIHQHMMHEVPRYVFLHYWGKGRASDLAREVKNALEAQKAVQ